MSLKIPNKRDKKRFFETTVKNWFNDQTQMIDRKSIICSSMEWRFQDSNSTDQQTIKNDNKLSRL